MYSFSPYVAGEDSVRVDPSLSTGWISDWASTVSAFFWAPVLREAKPDDIKPDEVGWIEDESQMIEELDPDTREGPEEIAAEGKMEWKLFSACLDAFSAAMPDPEQFRDYRVRSRLRNIIERLSSIKLFESYLFSLEFSNPKFEELLQALNKLFASFNIFIELDFVSYEGQKNDSSDVPRIWMMLHLSSEQRIQILSSSNKFREQRKLERLATSLEAFRKVAEKFFGSAPDERIDECTETQIAMAQSAHDFCKASSSVLGLLGSAVSHGCFRATEEHQVAFSIRAVTSGNPHLVLQFGLCGPPSDRWHLVMCTKISQEDYSSRPEVSNLCTQVSGMHRGQPRLYLSYTSRETLQSNPQQVEIEILDPELRVPIRDALESHGKDPLSLRDRHIVVIELARILLNSLGSPWLPEILNHEDIILFKSKLGHREVTRPFISSSWTRGDIDTGWGRDMEMEMEDLVLSFGIRMLEILAGQSVPKHIMESKEEDYELSLSLMGSVLKKKIPAEPALVLGQFREELDKTGAVDGRFLSIADMCLNFTDSVKTLRITKRYKELRFHLGFYKFIFEPLAAHFEYQHPDVAHFLIDLFGAVKQPDDGAGLGPNAGRNTTRAFDRTPPTSRTNFAQDYAKPNPSSATTRSGLSSRPPLPTISEKAPSSTTTIILPRYSPVVHGVSKPNKAKGINHFHSTIDTGEPQAADYAENFFALFNKFREKYSQILGSRPRVKVAILDTGLDREQIRARLANVKDTRDDKSDPIKEACYFVGASAKDMDGHGTNVTELLLKVAPDVDVYIAKISESRQLEEPEMIAEAITWAVNQKCSIISMSFGLTRGQLTAEVQEKIDLAIEKAEDSKVLMFAAASNCSGNGPPTYPASDGRVICVHATDGGGNDADLNPNISQRDDSIGTLGIGMKCSWNRKWIWVSGTSYSTPIAAGIAAHVLDFAWGSFNRGELSGRLLRQFQRNSGMRRMLLTLLVSKSGTRGRYVAPWHLWDVDDPVPEAVVLDRLKREL